MCLAQGPQHNDAGEARTRGPSVSESSTGLTRADPEEGTGGPDTLRNYKNIGFLSNTGPDPLKNHKATRPAFSDGQPSSRQRSAILMAFCWQDDDGPLIVVLRIRVV